MADTAPGLFGLLLVEDGDPRRSQAWHHPSGTILLIATLAVICGTDNWTAVESFGRQKRNGMFPGCRTAFPHRTPSVGWTLHCRDLLRHLGADAWMLPWSRPQRSQALCIAATLPRSAGLTGLTLVMSRRTRYQCPPCVCIRFRMRGTAGIPRLMMALQSGCAAICAELDSIQVSCSHRSASSWNRSTRSCPRPRCGRSP